MTSAHDDVIWNLILQFLELSEVASLAEKSKVILTALTTTASTYYSTDITLSGRQIFYLQHSYWYKCWLLRSAGSVRRLTMDCREILSFNLLAPALKTLTRLSESGLPNLTSLTLKLLIDPIHVDWHFFCRHSRWKRYFNPLEWSILESVRRFLSVPSFYTHPDLAIEIGAQQIISSPTSPGQRFGRWLGRKLCGALGRNLWAERLRWPAEFSFPSLKVLNASASRMCPLVEGRIFRIDAPALELLLACPPFLPYIDHPLAHEAFARRAELSGWNDNDFCMIYRQNGVSRMWKVVFEFDDQTTRLNHINGNWIGGNRLTSLLPYTEKWKDLEAPAGHELHQFPRRRARWPTCKE